MDYNFEEYYPVSFEGVGKRIQCPLCLEFTRIPTRIKCIHTFCAACMATYVSRMPACPVCCTVLRTNLDSAARNPRFTVVCPECSEHVPERTLSEHLDVCPSRAERQTSLRSWSLRLELMGELDCSRMSPEGLERWFRRFHEEIRDQQRSLQRTIRKLQSPDSESETSHPPDCSTCDDDSDWSDSRDFEQSSGTKRPSDSLEDDEDSQSIPRTRPRHS